MTTSGPGTGHEGGQAARERACCQSEPPCVLCPLAPQNAATPLAQLVADGLRGNLTPQEADALRRQAGKAPGAG